MGSSSSKFEDRSVVSNLTSAGGGGVGFKRNFLLRGEADDKCVGVSLSGDSALGFRAKRISSWLRSFVLIRDNGLAHGHTQYMPRGKGSCPL